MKTRLRTSQMTLHLLEIRVLDKLRQGGLSGQCPEDISRAFRHTSTPEQIEACIENLSALGYIKRAGSACSISASGEATLDLHIQSLLSAGFRE